MIMIYTNFEYLEYMMLKSKFKDNQSSSSGEDDFLAFLLSVGMTAILTIFYKFTHPFERRLHINLAFLG